MNNPDDWKKQPNARFSEYEGKVDELEHEAEQNAQANDVERQNSQVVATKPKYFDAMRIAYIAIFAALSFALRFAQFYILPAVSFLKFDFSDVFVLICAYALGPISGIITGVVKEVLYGAIFTSSSFVGELANILILVPFVLLPGFMYKKQKGIKSVIIWLSVACAVRVAWSFPVNLFLNFPAFLGFNWDLGMSMFWDLWYWVMLFNLIKTVILAVVVLLLYKSVSRMIHLINSKFIKNAANDDTAEVTGNLEESQEEAME